MRFDCLCRELVSYLVPAARKLSILREKMEEVRSLTFDEKVSARLH